MCRDGLACLGVERPPPPCYLGQMPKTCRTCHDPLAHPNQRFCCTECRTQSLPTKACEHCGKSFPLRWNLRQRFCSNKCRGLGAMKPRATVVCKQCNRPFPGKAGRVFCSVRCQGIASRRPAPAAPAPPRTGKLGRVEWLLRGPRWVDTGPERRGRGSAARVKERLVRKGDRDGS
jgi:predicted nucleic acid-binding Zn ribbon protein